jgi:hypothetical protein
MSPAASSEGQQGGFTTDQPEKVNRPNGEWTKGQSPDQDHMKSWTDCIRSRGTPNAPPEIGYRSAMAVHMANLSYKHKKRMTLEEAKSIQPEYS